MTDRQTDGQTDGQDFSFIYIEDIWLMDCFCRSTHQFDWLNHKKVIDPTMHKLFTNDVMCVALATLVFRDIMHLFRVMAICKENHLIPWVDSYR